MIPLGIGIMGKSIELIRVKIANLEAKLADLRTAERELVALEPELARTAATPLNSKPKPLRANKVASPARQTITGAIVEVLNAHGTLPAVKIAEYIKATGREMGKRTVSHSLQELKRKRRVRLRGGKWMLLKARSRSAQA